MYGLVGDGQQQLETYQAMGPRLNNTQLKGQTQPSLLEDKPLSWRRKQILKMVAVAQRLGHFWY